MKAWQYTSTKGGIEKNLKLNASVPLPKPKPNQHLVQIIASALNPVDYKPAELPIIGRLLRPKPATPGLDFAGRIVTPAAGSSLQVGDLIFGVAGTHIAGGALAEFGIVLPDRSGKIPEGVDPVNAATIGVAGLTAYQSIVPHVKKGDKIFINGGSGGCGCWGIQIAKQVGCHVTTACSTVNVELCKSLGADEVIDYKKQNVIETLAKTGYKYDFVVDNVGGDYQLWWRAPEYVKPEAKFVVVGHTISFGEILDQLKRKLLPGFLGGIKHHVDDFWPEAKPEDCLQIARWIREGGVRAVIDHKFSFDEAPQAFIKLKTGRARGKVVVDVASETYNRG